METALTTQGLKYCERLVRLSYNKISVARLLAHA